MSLSGFAAQTETAAPAGRWTEQRANAWYAQQPWLVGADYVPTDAINQLEMWQAATFDPQQIDKELGWAQAMGMNTMRVFLHDLLWQQDAAGLQQRINTHPGAWPAASADSRRPQLRLGREPLRRRAARPVAVSAP